MIDLTPLEVRKKKGDFRRVMRGYEPAVVDDFLDLAADRMEELVRDNLQFGERIRRLEEQVRDYRDRERALTEALVTAQEMREEMRVQTSREAEIARREAESEAAQIKQTAELARERAEQSIRQLRERQHQLVASYRAFLERELAEVAVVARALENAEAESADTASPALLAAPRAAAERARGPLFTSEDLESVFDVDEAPLDPRMEADEEAAPAARAADAAASRGAETASEDAPRPVEPERPLPPLPPFRFAFEDDGT